MFFILCLDSKYAMACILRTMALAPNLGYCAFGLLCLVGLFQVLIWNYVYQPYIYIITYIYIYN